MGVRFFELLGVANVIDAAAKWPRDRVQPDLGTVIGDTGFPELMTALDDALRFEAVRPGAEQPGLDPTAPIKVGFAAELHVTPGPLDPGIVLAQMNKIGFRLEDTKDVPAHIFVTRGRGGVEVAIHGLPVSILFPPGLFMPSYTDEEREAAVGDLPDKRVAPPPPPLGPIEGFDANRPDSLEITLSDVGSTRVRVRVNVRMTELGDFYFDTAVPISFGACRFTGLPVTGLHDVQLIPRAAPEGVEPEHVDAELPYEWKRHSLDVFPAIGITGLLAIRTVDLDMNEKPWTTLAEKVKADRAEADAVEFTVEDLVVPFYKTLIPPFPVHGRFGMRRQILIGDSGGERFNLQDAPVDIKVGPLVIRLFRVLLQTTDLDGESPVAFDAVVQRADGEDPPDPDTRWSFPVSLSDDGKLMFGVSLPVVVRPRMFTVFGRQVLFAGAQLGMSLPEIKKLIEGGGSAKDAFAVLADFEIRPPDETEPAPSSPVELADKVEPAAGPPPSMFFEGLGWKFGKPSLGAMYDPSDLELQLFKKVRLRIHEIGLVTEDNGGFYVSVSASLEKSFGSADAKAPAPGENGGPDTAHGACARTSAGRTEALARGYGVHLHRFRTRIAGNAEAPRFLLDGISIFFSVGKVEISGFGALSEYDLPPGNHYEEVAAGLQVCFKALGKNFDLGFQMYRGRVSGVDNFTYWMLGLVLGGLPIGSLELSGLRVLVVENLAPRLPAADGTDQPMRLYRWYKENLNAVELPQHRALTAWAPRDQSAAYGFAASITFAGTKAVRLDGFFFQARSPEDDGFVGGLELYALQAPQPLAFAAFEWDDRRDKWGLTIGFHVGLEALFGNIASWLGELTIAGLLFFGNKPDTIAIGQYNDTTTWPSLRFQFNRWWKLDVFLGGCWHRVDAADALDPTTESVNVFGAIVSAKGTVKFGIGNIKFYATLSWISSQWRNAAVATGHVLIIEAGVRVRVFGCFNFGAGVKVDHAVLGPGTSGYKRTSFILRIETPWWLPDVTVRWENTRGTPEPQAMPMISPPLSAGSALGPGPRVAVPIGVAGVSAPATLSLTQVRALPVPVVSESARDALALISCDSEIALDFTPSLDASATVLPGTPPSAGRQKSNQLNATYELVSIGIRRRPRHGGAWTDLVDPLLTELDGLEGLPPSEWEARFQSSVGFDWDADVVRLGRLDPRRLLINAATPYSFLSSNPEGDEILAATQPKWPCCSPGRPKPVWHVVDFRDTTVGTRTPATERFTESTSTWHWTGGRPPVVVPPQHAPAGTPVARLALDDRRPGAIATATFDRPAVVCEIRAWWRPAHSHARLVVEGYRGLALVSSQQFAMSSDDPGAPIRLEEPKGLTSVVLRKLGAPTLGSGEQGAIVEVVQIRYLDLEAERRAVFDALRCAAQDQRFHGQGRLAWLPNSDYEVTVETRLIVGYDQAGTQDATLKQKAFFRTKGLPGLNRVARIGEEVEPYVESVYPSPTTTLYRRESIALAFSERFNILAPIDRAPTAADPEERHRMMRWVLATEEAGGDGIARLSQTTGDWIVEHRPVAPPPRPHRPALAESVMATPLRKAASVEPLRVRLDRMVTRPGGCGGPDATIHTSQVLVHAPYDPARPDVATPRWPAGRTYRVNLRLEGAPFIERAPFEADDLGALTARTSAGSGAAWSWSGGALVAPVAALPQLATCGDAAWDHLQVVAAVVPGGQAAGIAAGVELAAGGAVAAAYVALVDERGGARLRLERRDGDTAIASATAPLPAGTPIPYVLEVSVFDDMVEARVAGTTVSLPRDQLRAGRLALVSEGGGGRFATLLVRGLDGYRFHATTSRYDTFADHIDSFGGDLGVIRPGDAGTPSTTPAALLFATSAEITAAMAPGADTAMRDRVFARWVADLALPLRQAPERLELTRFVIGSATAALLVESPEPLPLGGDVTLAIRKRRVITFPFPLPPVWTPQRIRVLTSSDARRAIVIPTAVDPRLHANLTPGTYRFNFTIDRPRWRAATPDATTALRDSRSLNVSW